MSGKRMTAGLRAPVRVTVPAAVLALAVGLAGNPAGGQIRQGGPYQIMAEGLDSGGGGAEGGSYSVRTGLPALSGTGGGGPYSLAAGYTAQLGGSGGTGAGPVAFAAWQTAVFGGASEPGAGAYEDPDGDGVVNLLEFAFNLPPLIPGRPLAGPSAGSGLPWIREEESGGQRWMTMEFIRRKNAGLFQPEVSASLEAGSWAPAGFTVISGPDSVSGAYERVKLRLEPAVQDGQRSFYRLKALIQ